MAARASAVLDSLVSVGLRQAEEGLLTLRKAGYFTEDEWIKLDGLIHKGRHVFTTGPVDLLAAEVPAREHLEFDAVNRCKLALTNEFTTSQNGSTSKLPARSSVPKLPTPTKAVFQGPSSQLPKLAKDARVDVSVVVKCPLTTTKPNKLQALAGDKIRVLKDLGDGNYRGLNLRTKETGLVSAGYVEAELARKVQIDKKNTKVATGRKVEKTGLQDRSMGNMGKLSGSSMKKASVSRAIDELDSIEVTSAAEWEEEEPSHTKNSSATADSSSSDSSWWRQHGSRGTDHDTTLEGDTEEAPSKLTGLCYDSMISYLPQTGNQHARNTQVPEVLLTKAAKLEALKRPICGARADPGRTCPYIEEICPNLHAFPASAKSVTSDSRSAWSPTLAHKEPAGQSTPPRKTCIWWANGRGCRYEDNECPNLHGYADQPLQAFAPDQEITRHFW